MERERGVHQLGRMTGIIQVLTSAILMSTALPCIVQGEMEALTHMQATYIIIAPVVTIILASYPGFCLAVTNEPHFPKKSLHVVQVIHCAGHISANT